MTERKTTLCAPVHGTVCTLSELPDAKLRAAKDGFAILPDTEADDILSPADGLVLYVSQAGDLCRLCTVRGEEIEVQIGCQAARMHGRGLRPYVRAGEFVSAGQRLLHAELGYLRRMGCTDACAVAVRRENALCVPEYRREPGEHARAGQTPVLSLSQV